MGAEGSKAHATRARSTRRELRNATAGWSAARSGQAARSAGQWAYLTSTVPFMFGCRPQMYSKVPAVLNGRTALWPLVMMDERSLVLTTVIWCGESSLFTHVTGWPTVAACLLGPKAKFAIVTSGFGAVIEPVAT